MDGGFGICECRWRLDFEGGFSWDWAGGGLDFDGGFGIDSGYHIWGHMWTVVLRSGGVKRKVRF